MSSSPTTESPAAVAFVCACKYGMRSACKGLEEYEDTGYCVLHYPGKDKVAAFNEVLKGKIDAQDFDFGGVWFPDEVKFSRFTFTTRADFGSATFSADAGFYYATFSADASFRSATFSAKASFYSSIFSADADFDSATFCAEASLRSATFRAKADFNSATFSAEADFNSTMFCTEASFYSAIFKDYARFAGGWGHKVFGYNSSLNLQLAKIEKPDRISFHTVVLSPHCFVNVDARKFEFINVDWYWQDISIKQEIKSLEQKNVSSPDRLLLLAIACRNLAVNAEENQRYEEASRFRYMAMDARRLEHRFGFAPWTLDWWYWLASGYGERMGKAFLVLLGILVLFAALYVGLGFPNWETKAATEKTAVEAQQKEPDRWSQLSSALLYSAGVMTLQKPDPHPATNAAQALVMLETILGPVQAALLALAIRRKFMR